jgi:hypothetical protein
VRGASCDPPPRALIAAPVYYAGLQARGRAVGSLRHEDDGHGLVNLAGTASTRPGRAAQAWPISTPARKTSPPPMTTCTIDLASAIWK